MLIQRKNWFPVLGIDRDDVEYTLGFDPELTDEQMKILTTALHDAIRRDGRFEHLLESTLGDLENTLGIIVPGQALWQCQTCGEWFYDIHWHESEMGYCVECTACEYKRKKESEQ